MSEAPADSDSDSGAERDPAFYTFQHPTTGTVHVLRSNPRQKTLEFPEDVHFHAVGFCGQGQTPLREGDITPHYAPLDLDEFPQLCRNCERVMPKLYLGLDWV